MTQLQQPRPTCTQCGKRPVVKDGKTKKGKVRYRSRCGSCAWKNRMEGVRDERTTLYKAAQQSEVRMLSERRLREKLGKSLKSWMEEADGRLMIIKHQKGEIASLKEGLASIKEGLESAQKQAEGHEAEMAGAVAKMQLVRADYARLREQNRKLAEAYNEQRQSRQEEKEEHDARETDIAERDAQVEELKGQLDNLAFHHKALLKEKCQWNRQHAVLEAEVEKHRVRHDKLRVRLGGFYDEERKWLNESRELRDAEAELTAALADSSAAVLACEGQIGVLEQSLIDQKESADRRYRSQREASFEASIAADARLRGKLTRAQEWSHKVTTVLVVGIFILLLSLCMTALT